MAHPILTRTTRTVATAAIAGATLLLPFAGAQAQLLDGSVEESDRCATGVAEELVEAACEAVDAVVGEVVAPVVEGAVEALAPVTDAAGITAPVQDLAEVVTGEEEAPVEQAPAAPAPNQPASPAAGGSTAQEPEEAKVAAAGKAPTEVTEPQAPAADGRIATAPTIQPADLGSNIAGVRSESGLTLQPYEAPMVSVPLAADMPEIALPPTTTATPIVEAAAEIVRFTGETMLPQTTGAAVWVTATGLGLLGAAGYVTRRRLDTLTATTLDA